MNNHTLWDPLSLFISAPGHIYWLDRNNVFQGCNNQQAYDAGLTHWTEIIGKTHFDFPVLLTPEMAAQLDSNNNQVMETGLPSIFEEATHLPDGTPIIMLSQKYPLFDHEGKVMGLIGTSLKITQKNFLFSALQNEKRL